MKELEEKEEDVEELEEKEEDVEDFESTSGDSFIDDTDDDGPSISGHVDETHIEAPLTEVEIEELINEFLEVESKAAEAQESLEKEELEKVEAEVREELAQTLNGDDLDMAVATEMRIFVEEWQATLDELETESAHLLEQLDGAGIELPSLYKWIESQAPEGCCTEAWRKRIQWVGTQMSNDITEFVADAEKYLHNHRPVRRRHGKLLEEGASGFLEQKLATQENRVGMVENSEKDWNAFNKIFSHHDSVDDTSFGGKHWASVYLASTPQQAATMGLKLPGVDEVEEIDDVDSNSSDPFIAAAMANEREPDLSEEQRQRFRKVKEEEDASVSLKLQLRLKRRRQKNRSKQVATEKEACLVDKVCRNAEDSILLNECSPLLSGEKSSGSVEPVTNVANCEASEILGVGVLESTGTSTRLNTEVSSEDGSCSVLAGSDFPGLTEPRVLKRSHDDEELETEIKRSRTVIIDSDDEVHVLEDKAAHSLSVPPNERQMLLQDEDGSGFASQNGNGTEISGKFHCTVCNKIVDTCEIHKHPVLNVIICRECKCVVEEKMLEKDPDCSECYCSWCGRSGDLISCKYCKMLFCIICIKRNLGEECLAESLSSGWRCCCCSPNLLGKLNVEYEKASGAGGQLVSGSDSDSEPSDTGVNVAVSSKKRRKKRIRRILDDAELGEETKRKIAIEKERQEHLKSLQVQFTAKSWTLSPASCNGNLPEGASVEVLGDASKGYIVNVVRDKDEEAVRIPPSISAKLKAHQIKGIRFMWQNIIQSIGKVKAGDKGLGCILAHTMGLGKTFQVIAFLYTAMRSVDLGLKTALIVTPVNVLHNWRQEFIKWRPLELKPLHVFMLDDVSRERRVELLAKWRSKGGIFLIGYSAFRNLSLGKHVKDRHVAREICYALQDGPDILVCDEAHMIKNTRADTTQALKQVKCQRRIALTGSPLQNNLMEYYCMVDFVREGFLGSSHEFRNRFQNPIENGQHANSTSDDVKIMNQRSHILYEQLKGFVQRMDMNVVKKDLPPKTVFVIAVKLSPLQRKLYKRFLDVHGFTSDKVSNEKMRRSFFAGYQALAQIWNHPGLLQMVKEQKDHLRREDAIENFLVDDSSSDDNVERDLLVGEKPRNKNEITHRKNDNGFFHEDWWKDLLRENNYREVDYSGKMVLVLDILSMSSEEGDKSLVFSQSLATLDLIELYLSRLPRKGREGKYWKQGKDWYRLDGNTEGSMRQKLVERFNEPLNKRVKCTLISTRAGSLGINLHAANRVIIVDGSWNPTYDLQAIYRAWRYGQKKPVYAYRLMAHGTMEEKIYKRQVTKEGLAARVVDRQQVHRTMSKEEMLHLFEFGDDDNLDAVTEGQQDPPVINGETRCHAGNSMKYKFSLSHGSCSSDKLMESLLGRHYPRWIANYHEHETLLQENEDEKLSKEEQDMAWEVFQRSFEWKEVQRVSVPQDELISEQKPAVGNTSLLVTASNNLVQAQGSSRNCQMQRKCTRLSHLLTLRSQGTKSGCSTVCGECAQEISWESLNRDGKSAR